jgi:hypothetical protein
LIPSSRGHNYAMTYLRLIPGTPTQVRPTTNNKQYSAQAIPALRWHKQHCPISPRSFPLQDRAPTFIPSRNAFLFVPLFLCPPRHALGSSSSAFRTRFPPRSSRRYKGGLDWNVAGAFLLSRPLVQSFYFSGFWASVSISASEFPGHRYRDCDSEQGRRTDAEHVRNWLHESIAYGSRTKHSITAKILDS